MNYKIYLHLVWLCTLFVSSTQVQATVSQTSFSVQATVTAACSVSASTLNFTSYDPTGGNVDRTTTVSITCTNGTAYNVGLDAGLTTGATVTTRQMTSGSNTLNYSLYSNSGRTTNWGNTSGTDTVPGTGSGAAQSLTVYGRIPGSQTSVVAGSYSDTITVTVYF